MNENPFLRRQEKSNCGSKAEKKTSKRLGSRLTMASGALDHDKGDYTLSAGSMDWLGENKSTVNDSLTLKHDWLIKISTEALNKSRYPVLSFSFVNGDGTPKKSGAWVAIPEQVFKKLLEIIGEN